MKYINNYEDYLREYKQFINHENSENMNEGVKHWLATFLMLVNLGIVPPAVMAANNDEVKKEFVQDKETLDKVASKFKTYYNQKNFYNTPEYAWEDFQNVYGTSTYSIEDIVESANISTEINEDIPTPTNYVNDYAELIYPQNIEDELNKKIKEYEETSGMEIAVVTVNSFEDLKYMSTFSQDVFETWGIGKVGSDNGILIAISEKDRDWRIQTGYGAEIVLTDAVCSRIGHGVLVPNFKNEDYIKGITETVNGIMEHIGYNSADIEQFKEDYKKAKAEKAEKAKQIFFDVIIILAILSLLIWLTTVLIKKGKERKILKEKYEEIVTDIDALMDKLEKELGGSKDLEYLKSIQNEYKKFVDAVNIPEEPIRKQETLDGMANYTRELRKFITKASQFNKYYKEALDVDNIVKSAKSYLSDIDKVNKEVSLYGKKSSNTITPEEFDKVANSIKTNIGSEKLFYHLDRIKGLLSSVRSSAYSIINVREDIPTMKKKIDNYSEQVNKWTDDLKRHNISEHTKKMMTIVKKFEKSLSLPEKDLFKKYAAYLAIKHFVDGVIQDENDRLRKIKEEKRRKQRRKEEEERAARRRRQSSYSSSSYGSSSGGSSFGGFGGGSSGGGGAGGSW